VVRSVGMSPEMVNPLQSKSTPSRVGPSPSVLGKRELHETENVTEEKGKLSTTGKEKKCSTTSSEGGETDAVRRKVEVREKSSKEREEWWMRRYGDRLILI
jgi:hypothetical protein